jgi:branched-chain amino acid transport system ATP-binding protein
MSVATATAALSADGVSVRFGGLQALRDVDIEVPPATIVGLLGPNGAGKSTLLGVLSGDVSAQQATVVLGGEPITGLAAHLRVRRGIARTFQHPELFAELSVRDHLVLAHRIKAQPSRSWSDVFSARQLRSPGSAEQVVDDVLVLLDLTEVADIPVGGLPLGVCRLVEIGRALATTPTVILLDEPFSGLNAGESHVLAAALARVVDARGISMLLVEHDVEIVFGLSSRIYVLDFGQLIAVGTPAEIRANAMVRSAYLGEVEPSADPEPSTDPELPTDAELQAPPGRDHSVRLQPRVADQATATDPADVCLRVESLAVDYGAAAALRDVSLTVNRRSVTALLGANGAGKSTLARALSGLVPVRSGCIEFNGVDITGWPAYRIRRLGLAYIPEGRGIFPALTVAENLRIGVQALPNAERPAAMDRAAELFPILGERRSQLAGTLSGGQQQMLSLARVLASNSALVIADEISLGLAPLIVDEVFEGLRNAIDTGVSMIVIEQFVHRALQLADECQVLRRGRVVWSGPASEARGDVFDLYLGNDAAAPTSTGSNS